MTDLKTHPRSDRHPSLHAIVQTFGGVLLENGRSALIPGPGHSPGDRSVSLRQLPDGRILIHCFSPKDDWRDVEAMLRGSGALYGVFRERSPPSVTASPQDKIARARKLWGKAEPISGTPAAAYLRARSVRIDRWPSALRYLPAATSLDDRRQRPALMAAIRNKAGDLQGVHVTLLSPRGSGKAHVRTPRRVIGKLSGGAVRLTDDGISGALIVAEGLETAMSASDALGFPAWAALNAFSLARFDPPDWTTHLFIAADRGAAGEAAAATLSRRMVVRGLPVEIAFAPDCHSDWNDWARGTP